MDKLLVSISCLTYNHGKYIKKCLDGFLMQKTNFKFEILIHDDASIDGTEEIIRKYASLYPKIIKPLYEKENQWTIGRRGSTIFNFPRAKGKYIALCEGDDYWTDPYKLQKQVDFLESNNEYGLIHTQIKKLFDITNQEIEIKKDRSKTSFFDLLNENPITTLTTCFNKELLYRYIDEVQPNNKGWIAGDTPIWLWFSIHSKIYFMNEITATYRVRLGSVSNVIGSKKYIEYIKSRLKIRIFFISKYFNSKKEYMDIIYQNFYKDAEYHALKTKDIKVINDIAIHLKKNKKKIKAYYFNFMGSMVKYPYTYKLLFFIYRIYHKIRLTN